MYNNPYSNYPYSNYGMPNYGQRPYAPQAQQPLQNTQQIPMQQQPQMQYELPIQDVRFVTSEEAKAYIVMPNSKALLIDKNSGVAHLKVADNMGQSQTQYFRFEPVNADGTPIKPQAPTSSIDIDEFSKKFATIEQYNALLNQFNELQKLIGGKPNVATKQTEQRV
jgi:hypothetical protein